MLTASEFDSAGHEFVEWTWDYLGEGADALLDLVNEDQMNWNDDESA